METYGNWLGPQRPGQAGIYSVSGKISPVGDFRPASPDSFEDDYDDVSMEGSDRGPPAKGVYLLAGPPGSALPHPQRPQRDSDPKPPNSDPKPPNSDPKIPDSDPKIRGGASKFGVRAALAALGAGLALGALAWAALLAAAVRREQQLRAELQLLRANLSGLWDSVQQDQTRLQFGIQQHQQELQELSALLCASPGGPRRCGAGWLSLGSRCYSFSRDSLPWAGARNACSDLGAHLVVVNSEEEQLFLLQHRGRGRLWLGVTDAEHEGRWRWVTGEEPQFRYWDVWAPEPEVELKDCGALGPRGFWVSERCSERLRWICEKAGNC